MKKILSLALLSGNLIFITNLYSVGNDRKKIQKVTFGRYIASGGIIKSNSKTDPSEYSVVYFRHKIEKTEEVDIFKVTFVGTYNYKNSPDPRTQSYVTYWNRKDLSNMPKIIRNFSRRNDNDKVDFNSESIYYDGVAGTLANNIAAEVGTAKLSRKEAEILFDPSYVGQILRTGEDPMFIRLYALTGLVYLSRQGKRFARSRQE